MIDEIRIKDFAIIDRLVVPLKEGLNLLTGETGAGKSIIVDALSVLLKEKVSSSDFIKHGKTEACIEVVIFDKKEDEPLILRRVLNIQGKNKSYINESPYTAQNFVNFVSQFINIHGQHEHTYLLKKESHIELFDNISGLKEDVAQLKELYHNANELKRDIEKLEKEIQLNKQKFELYQFQLEEIRNAHLKEEEEKDLNEKRSILRNALKLKELAELSFSLLYEERHAVYSTLSTVKANLEAILKFDTRAEEIKRLLDSANSQIEEAIFLLRRLKDSYEPDPFSLENIEERLNLIEKLKKKYGSTIGEVLEYAKNIEEKIDKNSLSEEELQKKQRQLNELSFKLNEKAQRISEQRIQKSMTIKEEILKELEFLGFSKPKFEISINNCSLNQYGIDEVEFLFSANPGEPPKPLNKVASGGELSRLMLALKCVELKLAKDTVKSITLIFDEIDAGIGGQVAENVGRRLKELSKHYQVLCITHLPQIAIFADNHLKVEKFIFEDRTFIRVEELSKKQRKEEIARMLSGRITESSLFHAEELLENK